jgi:hypothetical protein
MECVVGIAMGNAESIPVLLRTEGIMTKVPLLLSTIGLLVAFNADPEVPRLLANGNASAESRIAAPLPGDPAAPPEATRTITIAPGTKDASDED